MLSTPQAGEGVRLGTEGVPIARPEAVEGVAVGCAVARVSVAAVDVWTVARWYAVAVRGVP